MPVTDEELRETLGVLLGRDLIKAKVVRNVVLNGLHDRYQGEYGTNTKSVLLKAASDFLKNRGYEIKTGTWTSHYMDSWVRR